VEADPLYRAAVVQVLPGLAGPAFFRALEAVPPYPVGAVPLYRAAVVQVLPCRVVAAPLDPVGVAFFPFLVEVAFSPFQVEAAFSPFQVGEAKTPTSDHPVVEKDQAVEGVKYSRFALLGAVDPQTEGVVVLSLETKAEAAGSASGLLFTIYHALYRPTTNYTITIDDALSFLCTHTQ
jgi:hypothetical protein